MTVNLTNHAASAALAAVLFTLAGGAWAQPGGHGGDRQGGHSKPGNPALGNPAQGSPAQGSPAQGSRAQGNHGNHGASPAGAAPARGNWYDGGHSHNRSYPAPGALHHRAPAHGHTVYWGGHGYRFWDGVWYSPWNSGWVVVRPPFGAVLWDVPVWFTPVTVGGAAYLYANGAYYRSRVEGGYEVVPAPVASQSLAVSSAPNGPIKLYVYPRSGQSAQQQASDEFECHRWSVQQTGFDPTATPAAAAVVGGSPVAPVRVSTAASAPDYERARAACLEGRGYTVR